jgi:hypothetical protein
VIGEVIETALRCCRDLGVVVSAEGNFEQNGIVQRFGKCLRGLEFLKIQEVIESEKFG